MSWHFSLIKLSLHRKRQICFSPNQRNTSLHLTTMNFLRAGFHTVHGECLFVLPEPGVWVKLGDQALIPDLFNPGWVSDVHLQQVALTTRELLVGLNGSHWWFLHICREFQNLCTLHCNDILRRIEGRGILNKWKLKIIKPEEKKNSTKRNKPVTYSPLPKHLS